MKTPDLALGVIWYIVFLFSTTCHEASHALAAKIILQSYLDESPRR